MSEFVDRIVRDYVIRDDCPCGDCVEDNWMKIRAIGVVIVPGLLATWATTLEGVPVEVGMLAVLLTFIVGKDVGSRIDAAIKADGCRNGGDLDE